MKDLSWGFHISDQINDYLQYCEFKRDFTQDTLKTKRYHLNRFVRDNPSVSDLRELTNQQLDNWCAALKVAGRKPKTINNHMDDVVGCVKFLKNKREQFVRLNFDAVERNKVLTDIEELPTFTRTEIQKIRQHCSSLREQLLFSATFETALRLKEITNLRVEDIKTSNNGRSYFRVEGKGRVKRNTFMLASTKKLFDRWLLLAGIEEGYIFPSPVKEGLPFTEEQIRKIITRPIRAAGFEVGGPHAIRRSSITTALEGGMAIADAAKWAGHSDPRITLKHYYKPNVDRLGDEHEKAFSSTDKHY